VICLLVGGCDPYGSVVGEPAVRLADGRLSVVYDTCRDLDDAAASIAAATASSSAETPEPQSLELVFDSNVGVSSVDDMSRWDGETVVITVTGRDRLDGSRLDSQFTTSWKLIATVGAKKDTQLGSNSFTTLENACRDRATSST
jgi:hypothetical protein